MICIYLGFYPVPPGDLFWGLFILRSTEFILGCCTEAVGQTRRRARLSMRLFEPEQGEHIMAYGING